MYIRKVCYLDCLEQGNRTGNAGYVKICLHDDRLAIEVHIKGLGSLENKTAWIVLERQGDVQDDRAARQDIRLAQIKIGNGSGSFHGELDAGRFLAAGESFELFRGLKVVLSEERMLYADFRFRKPEQPECKAAEVRPAVKEETAAVVRAEEKEDKYKEGDGGPSREWMPDPLDKVLSADKWEQLCKTHKKLHPFGDKTYISLTPKDFVILRKEYQQLVNNSFLLHGFYNYRHLILGKETQKEEEVYYLGVPGTYYEREKMVAVMFGFEGFEASGEEEKTAASGFGMPPGTFGYYMKRVEI